ncbi:aminopeptidase Ey-like, partial [Hyalella azteca]|uniref:Aminopeptidase Ey-like n=1 Tax=Hyalella azteca TaxID=294128 RepID=A0A8B7N6F0_HYAAZ
LVPYHVPLNITRYLREEVSLVPWLAAFNNFKYLNSMLRSSPLYGAFKKHPPEVEAKTLVTIRNWNIALLGVDTSFDRGGGAFCAAVRRGGELVWTAVWRLFSHTPNPARREALGQALGCTREAWLINRYLQSGLRGAELVDALRWTRQTDVGLEVAWQYVWNQRKVLIRTPEVFPSIIKTLAQDFHTEHHQFMLSELLKLTSVDIRHSLAGVIQAVENSVNWHQRSYAQIKRWLEEAGFPAGVGETFNYRAA